MDSGIDYQTHSAEKFRRKASIVGSGVLVKADLFAELLGVERPAFRVSVEAQTVEAELGQPGELLLHGELHVMAWNAFMVGDGFVINKRAIRKIGCGHNNAAGSLAVGSSGY